MRPDVRIEIKNTHYTIKMWGFIAQNILLSICIVFLIQYLWDYFKPVHHSRKTKDIVDFQTKKYREILTAYEKDETPKLTTDSEYISAEEKDQMVAELLSFIEI
jgi:uncharacterized membrane protein YukC